ncbi:MAG: hypothetical protein ACFFDW_02050 [Candidatus Thorarchaeota archaeon]
MEKKITYEDLILIFGKEFIPSDIDRKILMKHFDVGVNRIIGERTIEKIKTVLIASIDSTRKEYTKERGRVLDSPLEIYSKKEPVIMKKPILDDRKTDNKIENKNEDKYGLGSIQTGLVSKRLQEKTNTKSQIKDESTGRLLEEDKDSSLPSIEDLKLLSGGSLTRDMNENTSSDVQREISIREYQVQDENRSARWGSETIKDREGKIQEINNPAYIFHTDLWQFEEAREKFSQNRCDILQHAILDMVANNINVVMIENEEEPFFIVEGHGILHSKDSLKDKIKIDELIHLVVISSDAWQIALKKPEALIKGYRSPDTDNSHSIDMTSVIPLAAIRSKIVELDSKFKVEYLEPDNIINKTLQAIDNHRKNVVWSCGSQSIPILRDAIAKHRAIIDSPQLSLNMVIIGTHTAFHPLKIKFDLSGNFQILDLLPNYCKKHTILSENSVKNIFGSIPAIYDTSENLTQNSELVNIAYAVLKRLGYSATETIFDLGYIRGNMNDTIPISKLDIILPLPIQEMQQKFIKKGFNIE